jgi:hypothetical protein
MEQEIRLIHHVMKTERKRNYDGLYMQLAPIPTGSLKYCFLASFEVRRTTVAGN